jgi:3-hydroxyacyl-CoA dehydrogenase
MRQIKNVTVLGSGTMGMGIAAHYSNAGCEVLLLDIIPANGNGKKVARNALAAGALKKATRARMNPFYAKKNAKNISIGNFEDDFQKIEQSDLIVEVVVENLEIKKQLFEKVDNYRKQGSIIATNTSSIPIALMKEGRSEDFRKHFLGMHFFNPVRYMDLLEIIPTEETQKELVEELMIYGKKTLGKTTVLCKDTPAFIANRISVASGIIIQNLVEELGLSVEEADAILGQAIGRPKTGIFRLQDLVGIDVNEKVMDFMATACPNDALIKSYKRKPYLNWMLENQAFGNKTGKGFYQKTVDEKGKKQFLALDLKTFAYAPVKTVEIAELSKEKDLVKRLQLLLKSDSKTGTFLRRYFGQFFAYISHRVPEISNNLYSIDDAMRAGYAWELGPFEYWDAIGGKYGLELALAEQARVADWAKALIDAGKTFYGKNGYAYYDASQEAYHPVKSRSTFAKLGTDKAPVYKNGGVQLHDIGDGVLCLEFTSKGNFLSQEVLEGVQEAVQLAEKDGWKGLVIGNTYKNFSVGANLNGIAQLIEEKAFKNIENNARLFQKITSGLRYATLPVVAAVHGNTLGGGAEIMMHCDSVVAAAESYIGLPEASVGLLPAGGGVKEAALRLSNNFFEGDVMMPSLTEKFNQIALSKISGSAFDALEMGLLEKGKDIIISRKDLNIEAAKNKVLALAKDYSPKGGANQITVLGQGGMANLFTFINGYKLSGWFTEHDILVAKKISWVLCGGNLSGIQQVTEQYLLDLEAEAFASLAAEPKTFERIKYMLKTKKRLRN